MIFGYGIRKGRGFDISNGKKRNIFGLDIHSSHIKLSVFNTKTKSLPSG